ncbi:hypothetical protein Pelo_10636 [Pelomyxa schiedti]|nr:hypothetical protein Pelo_10636 [Pelomyxa schiedti]
MKPTPNVLPRSTCIKTPDKSHNGGRPRVILEPPFNANTTASTRDHTQTTTTKAAATTEAPRDVDADGGANSADGGVGVGVGAVDAAGGGPAQAHRDGRVKGEKMSPKGQSRTPKVEPGDPGGGGGGDSAGCARQPGAPRAQTSMMSSWSLGSPPQSGASRNASPGLLPPLPAFDGCMIGRTLCSSDSSLVPLGLQSSLGSLMNLPSLPHLKTNTNEAPPLSTTSTSSSTSTSQHQKPPSAFNGESTLPTGKRGPQSWSPALNYFEETIVRGEKKRQCKLTIRGTNQRCTKTYSPNTSSTNLCAHLRHAHDMKEADISPSEKPITEPKRAKKTTKSASTGTLIDGVTAAELEATLGLIMSGTPLSEVQNPWFRNAFMIRSEFKNITEEKLHVFTEKIHKAILQKLHSLVAERPVSVSFDCGTDPTDNIGAAATEFKHLISECFHELELANATVISVTCEAAELSGLHEALSSDSSVLNICCNALWTELAEKALLQSCPPLNAVITKCEDIADQIKNSDEKRSKLQELQKALGQPCLKLVVSNSTKKFWAHPLLCGRILELTTALTTMELAPPAQLDKVVSLLKPFQQAIDICQKESGSILDNARTYYLLKEIARQVCELWPECAHSVEETMNTVFSKFLSCGISHLACCLLPGTKLGWTVSIPDYQEGVKELHHLVETQFPRWKARSLLPVTSASPATTLYTDLLSQLGEHVHQGNTFLHDLAKEDPTISCKKFWCAAIGSFPQLSDLALLLCSVGTPDSDCERIFSWEGFQCNEPSDAVSQPLVGKMLFIFANFEKVFKSMAHPQPPVVVELDYDE